MKKIINNHFVKILIFLFSGIILGKFYSYYNLKNKKNDFTTNSANEFIVTIKGAVNNPGKYKFKKGTRFSDLIKASGGYAKGAKKIKKNYYLKNNQIYTIKYRKNVFVKILGEIKKPGNYQLLSGAKLYKLIKLAGGITKKGYKPKINFILRNNAKIMIYAKIKVSIFGEIIKPGTYFLKKGNRLYDLIKLAGGITPHGYKPYKNYYLKDGQKFFIFKRRK